MDGESGEPAAAGAAAERNAISGGAFHGTVIQAGHIGHLSFSPPAASTPAHVAVFQVPPLAVRPVDHKHYMGLLDRYLGEPASDGTRIGYGAVDGLPGLGKTTLACRWASGSRGLFPDGQLYVDFGELRRQDGAGGAVSAAVGRCLRYLGVDDRYIPDAFDQRVTLYRQRTGERRLLVVLDDVTQPAQVSSLLPAGPGSALLVTSTARLGELMMDGARMISLEPLDPADGLELLTDLCSEQAVAAEAEAAERLVELCAGVPKALHLVAARLMTTGGLTMTRLAGELADESRRLSGLALREEHSVSAVLGLAYTDLPAEPARLYRLLGWLPGRTFDAGAAAAAARLDVDRARLLLRELERANLIDATGDERYRFHDLVRLHARERAAAEEPEGERRALVTRLATHYLALTAWADRTVREDRLRLADLTELLARVPNPFAADGGTVPLDWLEAERGTIMAVLREASSFGLDELVGPLAEAFTVLFLHHRYVNEWAESLEAGAAAAARAGQRGLEARLRSLLSRPLMDLGRYEEAHAALRRATDLARTVDHRVLQASVQEFFGRYHDRTDPALAPAAYQRCLELNTEAGEWRGVALARYFLGCAQDAGGRHAEALETLEGARQAFLDLPDADLRMAARAQAAGGLAQAHQGDVAGAAETLRAAVRALHAQEAYHYEAAALVHLADLTESAGGGRQEVREHLSRAYAIHDKGGSPDAEVLRVRIAQLCDTEGGTGTGR